MLRRVKSFPLLFASTKQSLFFFHCVAADAVAKGWGPVPDSDAFCRYLLEVANVSVVAFTSERFKLNLQDALL